MGCPVASPVEAMIGVEPPSVCYDKCLINGRVGVIYFRPANRVSELLFSQDVRPVIA